MKLTHETITIGHNQTLHRFTLNDGVAIIHNDYSHKFLPSFGGMIERLLKDHARIKAANPDKYK